MKDTYEVNLPLGRIPKYPNRCVACGKEHPSSAIKLSTRSFEWWMVLVWLFVWLLAYVFKRTAYSVPACEPCARRFMWQYRIRFAIEMVLILAATIAAFHLVQTLPRPWRKLASIGAACLLLIPLLSWQVIWPMAVQLSADRSTAQFEFTDPQYAQDFTELNLPQPEEASEL